MLSLRPDDSCVRVRDARRGRRGRWRRRASAASARGPRVPPQVLRVLQVRQSAGSWRPLLPSCWLSRLRTGLAQTPQGIGGGGGRSGCSGSSCGCSGRRRRRRTARLRDNHHRSTQRQSGPTEKEPRLGSRSVPTPFSRFRENKDDCKKCRIVVIG